MVLAFGLLARLRLLRAWALWPDPDWPSFVVELAAEEPARWLDSGFERRPGRLASGEPRGTLRRLVGPATWSALRARGLLVGPPAGIATEAFRRGFGRPPERPQLVLYSVGHTTSKASCFVFEGDAPHPVAVVRIAPGDRAANLRSEVVMIEAVRREAAARAGVSAALPAGPLFSGEIDGDYVVVLPADPLAPATGREDRAAALRWLHELQDATRAGNALWGDEEVSLAADAVRRAWRAAGREVPSHLLHRLDDLRGAPFFRCAVHGDFWRGNIASDRGRIRVYDWEWARLGGQPFLDLWVYELSELRLAARRGRLGADRPLEPALVRVQAGLADRGLDPRFAVATLAPSLAELALRIEAGKRPHPPLVALMVAVEAELPPRSAP